MVLKAAEAKKQGDLFSALDHHTQAAKLYKDIAVIVRDKNRKLRDAKCSFKLFVRSFEFLIALDT